MPFQPHTYSASESRTIRKEWCFSPKLDGRGFQKQRTHFVPVCSPPPPPTSRNGLLYTVPRRRPRHIPSALSSSSGIGPGYIALLLSVEGGTRGVPWCGSCSFFRVPALALTNPNRVPIHVQKRPSANGLRPTSSRHRRARVDRAQRSQQPSPRDLSVRIHFPPAAAKACLRNRIFLEPPRQPKTYNNAM